MATTALHADFDAAGFSSALEDRDVRRHMPYFAECAQVCVVTRAHPASAGRNLVGRREVENWLSDLWSGYPHIYTVELLSEGANLLVIAEALGVTTDYLLGCEDL